MVPDLPAQPRARSRTEGPHLGVDQGLALQWSFAYTLVFRYQHPTVGSDDGKPVNISRSVLKVRCVLLDCGTAALGQRVGYQRTGQVGVCKESKPGWSVIRYAEISTSAIRGFSYRIAS